MSCVESESLVETTEASEKEVTTSADELTKGSEEESELPDKMYPPSNSF